MQYSISTGYYLRSLEPDVSLENCLDSIRNSEFGAEIGLSGEGAQILKDRNAWSNVKAICKDMPALSAHSGYTNQMPWAEFLKELDFCAHVGADPLVCHPKTFGIAAPTWAYDGPILSDDDIAVINRALTEAASRSIRLAIENGPASILDQAIDAMSSHPDRRYFGICIDTGHANMHRAKCDSPVVDILHERDHIIHIHVHDNHGESDDHLIPGEGAGDWEGIFRQVKDLGYDGNIVFELASNNPLDAAIKAKKYTMEYLS